MFCNGKSYIFSYFSEIYLFNNNAFHMMKFMKLIVPRCLLVFNSDKPVLSFFKKTLNSTRNELKPFFSSLSFIVTDISAYLKKKQANSMKKNDLCSIILS